MANLKNIGCFVAGIVLAIIGFVALTIYVSFIREKEKTEEEPEPFVAMVDEQTMRMREPFELPALYTRRCTDLAVSSIKVGSWWTDGDVYFKVLSNQDDTLYMVGTDLENRGMEITFVKQDESTMITDGASVFAMDDSPVIARQIRLADGSSTQVLVAFYDSAMIHPQSLLQRYHGKGLEKQQVLP